MLRLPDPMLTFKGEDCREFLKKHDNGLDLLPEFLENPTTVPGDMTRLQVSAFKNPFWEIAWLFTRITGQESTTNISRMILYILYFTVKEQAIFDWGKLISIEISSQLLQYTRQKKLFMSSCNTQGTNESYKQKRKGPGEKSAQSPTATPNTTTSRSNAPTTYPSKKVTHSSSGGGGDKNPPFGKIESSHKLPASKK
jgi:hypothetical protein